jgi:hypothetical protein
MRTAGEGVDCRSLREARQSFQQHVTSGDQTDEEAIDERVLADDEFLDFGADAGEVIGGFANSSFQGFFWI